MAHKPNNVNHSRKLNPELWGAICLCAGGFGLASLVGFGALLVLHWSLLLTVIAAMSVILTLVLGSLLQVYTQTLSQAIGRNRRAQIGLWALLGVGLLPWPLWGGAVLWAGRCGPLPCPPPGVRWFVMGDWEMPPLDANSPTTPLIQEIPTILYQRLDCLGALAGIGWSKELSPAVLDGAEYIKLSGRFQIGRELTWSITLTDAQGRPRQIQPLDVHQPMPQNQQSSTDFELQLRKLQNEMMTNLLDALDLPRDAATSAHIERIRTQDLVALRWNNEGAQLLQQKQLNAAEEHLLQAIARDKDYADAYNNLGQLYTLRGDFVKASDYYRQATTKVGCVPLYNFNLGFAYEEQQNDDAAIAAYQHAIALNPAYVKAVNNLGYVYLRKGSNASVASAGREQALTEAAKWLDYGIKIDDRQAYLYKNRGRVYLEQGRFDQAIADLQQAIARFPRYAEAHYYLAVAYTKRNQPTNACAELKNYKPLAAEDAQDVPTRPTAAQTLITALACS